MRSGGIGADELDVVHGLDGVLGFGVLGEAHEAKAAAAASIAVLDHDLRSLSHDGSGRTATYGLFHLAEFLKLGSERYIIRVPREAAAFHQSHWPRRDSGQAQTR